MRNILCVLIMYVLIDGVAIAGASVRYKDIVFNQVKIDSLVYSTQNGKPFIWMCTSL